MPKVLCFDFDDTLLDDKSKPIRIEEVCDAIVRHQAAGGMILFVTDKKAFSIHDMRDGNEPIPKLLSSMNGKGVNIRTNDSVNFSIIANSDTTGVVTNLYTNYLLLSPDRRGFGFKIIDSNLILEPTEPCLGKILWQFNNIVNISLKEGENTPLEIEVTVNGNSVKINTDLKSLLEISDGKFLHILLGLIGNGYMPDNLVKKEGIVFSIENIRGCEKIAIEDILLIDDKRTNLEKFDSLGGKILFPDTPYLQGHVVQLIEREYKVTTFNTADSVDVFLKFIDGVINRGIFDEHVRAAWELKKNEFKEKIEDFKKSEAPVSEIELKALAQEISNFAIKEAKERKILPYIPELQLNVYEKTSFLNFRKRARGLKDSILGGGLIDASKVSESLLRALQESSPHTIDLMINKGLLGNFINAYIATNDGDRKMDLERQLREEIIQLGKQYDIDLSPQARNLANQIILKISQVTKLVNSQEVDKGLLEKFKVSPYTAIEEIIRRGALDKFILAYNRATTDGQQLQLRDELRKEFLQLGQQHAVDLSGYERNFSTLVVGKIIDPKRFEEEKRGHENLPSHGKGKGKGKEEESRPEPIQMHPRVNSSSSSSSSSSSPSRSPGSSPGSSPSRSSEEEPPAKFKK